MGMPKTQGRGGPRSAAGKAACSRNALKSGIAARRWLQPGEQEEFERRLAELHAEYPDAGPSISILLERIATNIVKLNRQDGIEDALYGAARLSTEQFTAQRIEHPEGGFWPDTEPGRLQATQVLRAAAMPDLHRLEVVARYQNMLERQISKQIGEVVHLYDRCERSHRAGAPGTAPTPALTSTADSPPDEADGADEADDIDDVRVNPVP